MKGAGVSKLRSEAFRRERKSSWLKLERLVVQAEHKGIQALSPEEMTTLTSLHRSVVSSLSVARSISLDKNLTEYLENLCTRSYFCVYGSKRRLRMTLAAFFLEDFPAAVRRFRWHVVTSAAFLVLGVLVGFVQTLQDQDMYYSFVAAGYADGRDPTASTEALAAALYDGGDSAAEVLSTFASFLFAHNAQIGMLAFALGFAAGLPVFYLLFSNGLLLGAMAALYHSRGLSADFWAWVLPHGVTELLAVVLCGAGGLVIAQAVVLPGRHTRLANLAIQGRKAGILVLGSVALLLLAALIEGFFRQLVTAIEIRWLMVLFTIVLWIMYFALIGRRRVA
jgi:uncharacterized membrane protein SpoIIM required for sporulation